VPGRPLFGLPGLLCSIKGGRDMNRLERLKVSAFWNTLVKLQRILLVLSSVFVVLIMCVEVLLRYVFKSDLFGIEEIVVIAAFWLYFIGSSYGVYEKSHVTADIIPQLLSHKMQKVLTLVIHCTMFLLCVIFSWWAVDMVRYSIVEMPRTTGLRIPIFISQSSVLVGYLLMTFYSGVHVLEDLLDLGPEEKASAAS
jgi:TRAP-type C4-dicarboxylate transport system permease small subunit